MDEDELYHSGHFLLWGPERLNLGFDVEAVGRQRHGFVYVEQQFDCFSIVISFMNIQLTNPSYSLLLIHSIIAGIIYLLLVGGHPVEAQSQEIMSTKASMENLNGMLSLPTISTRAPVNSCTLC